MEELLQKLKDDGGAIVTSNECTVFEIAGARADGRMFVDKDGIGFVLRPQIWLDATKGLALIVASSLSENA